MVLVATLIAGCGPADFLDAKCNGQSEPDNLCYPFYLCGDTTPACTDSGWSCVYNGNPKRCGDGLELLCGACPGPDLAVPDLAMPVDFAESPDEAEAVDGGQSD
jgi:hypothetical protein